MRVKTAPLLAVVLVLLPPAGALGAELPKPPVHANRLGVRPVSHCEQNQGVYEETWDPNPATEAVFSYYGRYVRGPDGRLSLELPVVARIADDAGVSKFFMVEDSRLVEYESAVFVAKYNHQWCNVPGLRAREK